MKPVDRLMPLAASLCLSALAVPHTLAQCPSPTFGAGTLLSTGSVPFCVVAYDLDGNGLLDYVTADTFGGLTVRRSFASNVSILAGYAAGSSPISVAVGDFNLDGRPDLVSADYGSNTVSVLLQNADHTFQSPVQYAVGFNPRTVVTADFNGDNRPDLACTNVESGALSILLNNAGQGFLPAVSLPTPGRAYALATADFNHDGAPDLVSSHVWGDDVYVRLNDGAGNFGPPIACHTAHAPAHITVGDLNGDGNVDMAISCSESNTLTVIRGNGDGTFVPGVEYAVGDYPVCAAAADLNGDGVVDLAVTNYRAWSCSILRGNPDGSFRPAVTTDTVAWPRFVIAADVEGDDRPELVVVSETQNAIAVRPNTTGECADRNHNGQADADDIAAGTSLDCNGDQIPDECQHLNGPTLDGSPSLFFDGGSQYVEIPWSEANNPANFTVEMWVKYTGPMGSGQYRSPLTSRFSCCEFYSLAGYTFYMTPDDRWLFMTGANDGGSWSSLEGPTVVPGKWTHLAATYDAASDMTALLVDGVTVASAAGFRYVPNTYFPLRIGAGRTEETAVYMFTGQIDDVRIWDHARSQSQIATAMGERLAGNEPGLNTLFQLDDLGDFIVDTAPAWGNDWGLAMNAPYHLVPRPCDACPADFNGDGFLDFFDYDDYVLCFEAGICPPALSADFNGDGFADFFDYDDFVLAFEAGC